MKRSSNKLLAEGREVHLSVEVSYGCVFVEIVESLDVLSGILRHQWNWSHKEWPWDHPVLKYQTSGEEKSASKLVWSHGAERPGRARGSHHYRLRLPVFFSQVLLVSPPSPPTCLLQDLKSLRQKAIIRKQAGWGQPKIRGTNGASMEESDWGDGSIKLRYIYTVQHWPSENLQRDIGSNKAHSYWGRPWMCSGLSWTTVDGSRQWDYSGSIVWVTTRGARVRVWRFPWCTSPRRERRHIVLTIGHCLGVSAQMWWEVKKKMKMESAFSAHWRVI